MEREAGFYWVLTTDPDEINPGDEAEWEIAKWSPPVVDDGILLSGHWEIIGCIRLHDDDFWDEIGERVQQIQYATQRDP